MIAEMPTDKTVTNMTEYHDILEERIGSCDSMLKHMNEYINANPDTPRLQAVKLNINSWILLRSDMLNEQTSVEEWLIDHNAPGWTST